jgi:RNA polymerase sporulation-specific sigma factor
MHNMNQEPAAAPEYRDTIELLKRARTGDMQAEEQLIRDNMALVHSVAKRFRDRGADYEDLFQIGCVGFVKAIKNFDMSYNVCFSTYAVPMIMGEIRRFLRDDGPMKISRSIKEKARLLLTVQERLSERLQREPTAGEIATEAGIAAEEISYILEAMNPIASIDEEMNPGAENPIKTVDRLPDDSNHPDTQIDKLLVKELLSTLEPRERQIIIMRYFQEKTQSEIADAIGVSQVQISRLEGKILIKMRNLMST